MAVVDEVVAHPAGVTVLVSHGNLIALLLNHFDGRVGFAEWQFLSNPDVYLVTVEEAGARVERVWNS